jgi:type II secretory pathway pseudopilin PulG
MSKVSLAKYRVGLAVIGLFAVGILVVVLIQAGANKQDTATYNRATTMANTLNDYISSKNIVPESLAGAGINNAAANIRYHKLSSSSYKFCVDYKTTSSGFNATGVVTDLATGVTGQSGAASSGNTSPNTYLYLNSTHRKGENCQTIQPTLYNSFNNTGSGNLQDPYAKCNSIQDNTAWQQCINNINNTQNSQSTTLTN